MNGIDYEVLRALKDHLQEKYNESAENIKITDCGVSGGMTSINGYRVSEIAPHKADGVFRYYRIARCEPSNKKSLKCHSFESRFIEYHKKLIKASDYGTSHDMTVSLDCVSGKLWSGTLTGREWNYKKQKMELAKVPKSKALTYIGATSKFKEYEVIVGDNEFSFIVNINDSKECSIKFGDIIEV